MKVAATAEAAEVEGRGLAAEEAVAGEAARWEVVIVVAEPREEEGA